MAEEKHAAPGTGPTIVYCRCAYAQALPKDVKNGVLKNLCASKIPFQAVSDLCEMSARSDPRLQEIADQAKQGEVKIVACFPRAVRWLFHAAETPLPEKNVEIINLREKSVEEATEELLSG